MKLSTIRKDRWWSAQAELTKRLLIRKTNKSYLDIIGRLTDYKEIVLKEHEALQITTDLRASYKPRSSETIIKERIEIKNKFGDVRRSEISNAEIGLEDEDLIPVEDIFVTLTNNGYIKRVNEDTYRTQSRGGRGIKGMSINDDDTIDSIVKMSTHDDLMIFTNKGKVFRIKGYSVPASGRTSKGIPIINLIQLSEGEEVNTIFSTSDKETKYFVFVTKEGLVKRVEIEESIQFRQTGKIAIALKADDELVGVRQTYGDDEIIIGGSKR